MFVKKHLKEQMETQRIRMEFMLLDAFNPFV